MGKGQGATTFQDEIGDLCIAETDVHCILRTAHCAVPFFSSAPRALHGNLINLY